MMKRWNVRSSILTTVFVMLGVLGSGFAHAQTSEIPNGRFEDWTQVEDSAYTNPLFWSSLNEIHYLLGYDDFTVSPSTDALEGSLALRAETKKFCTDDSTPFCFLVPGSAVLGEIFINPADLSITSFGVDFSERPMAFTGWYKYFPVLGDSCLIEVELSRYNASANTREVIATGEFRESSTVSQYSPMSVNLTYYSTATPNKLRLTVHSGVKNEPFFDEYPEGSTLFLDWSNLGEPLIISSIDDPEYEPELSLFPVPASYELNVRWDKMFPGNGVIEVYDLTGRLAVQPAQVAFGQASSHKIRVADLDNGLYRLIVRDESGRVVDSRSFQVMH